MRLNTFLLIFLALCGKLGADIITKDPHSSKCVAFRDILELNFVKYAAIYFADNPRGTDTPIVPQALDPETARNLFATYYGEEATSQTFEEVFSRIFYSDPGNKDMESRGKQANLIEADRIVLRDNIYIYAKSGSFNLAREKFGVLLYRSANEVGGKKWKDYRCIENEDDKYLIEGVIHTELAKLRNEIGEFKFGQFLGLGSGTTLAFAIDDTGSMGGEIGAAKLRAISIIDERQGSLDQPQNFVLVPFNDPGVGPLTVTHDPDVFKAAINRLYAHGGGDAPELSMRGIQLAVENSNAGSSIFVITDVDAKDVELQDNVIAQAKQKNIRITFLLTNDISSTVCSAVRTACENQAYKVGYKLYEYIATSTGGKILVVTKNDVFKATEVIESTLRQGVVEIYRSTFDDGEYSEGFYVDNQLSMLYIQTVGSCGDVQISRPDGSIAIQEGKLVVDKLVETRTEINGVLGLYSISGNASGTCDVTISSKSPKGFIKTLAKRITNPETGEITIERFEGQALITDDVVVLIDVFGKQPGDKTELIEIIDRDTGVSNAIILDDVTKDHYVIPVHDYPGSSLKVVMKGKDKTGVQFQRTSPSNIERVSLDIDCSNIRDMVFRPGRLFHVNVTVRNVGENQTFSMESSDDKLFVVKRSPFRVSVDAQSTAIFPLSVKADKEERRGAVSTITITASPEKSRVLIFKQCRLIVGQRQTPDIESFHIVSNINSRFVETSISSTVNNNAKIGRLAEFHVIMPVDAFITEFSMTIDGVNYPGDIEEKEQAKKLFDLARSRGLTAGHVAARDKSVKVFRTSVNLEAEKRVLFNLKYQQLLRRSGGKYRHEIIAQTKQPVGKLSIDVYICENRPLTPVRVLGFDTDQSIHPGPIKLAGATVDQQRTTAHVSFKPTRAEQLKYSPLGLNGKFVIEYDVERSGGKEVNEVVASDGHFVHFFSTDLATMSKRVVFLLDNSGSMYGRKMAQVRSAMSLILDGLNSQDHFAIVMFNSNVTRWEPSSDTSMVPATEANKKSANEFLKSVKTTGSTNIEVAITEAVDVLREFTDETEKSHHPTSDYILLLTDGRPTEGFVKTSELVNHIDVINDQTYGIHTIGFGTLVDIKTLAKIAARNKGSSIQIFEDLDADLQINDFFETIARPMLRDIEITYNPEQVITTSTPNFTVLNGGSEIVVAGELLQLPVARRVRRETIIASFIDIDVKAKGKDDKEFVVSVQVEPLIPSTECLEDSTQVENFTERLNIFMDLQHTLKEISAEDNKTKKAELKEMALNKSLEYGFVTPGITSMLVLKPDDKKDLEETLAAEEAKKKEEEEKKLEDEKKMKEDERLTSDSSSLLGLSGTSSGLDSSFIGPRALSIRPMIRPPAFIPPPRLGFFGDPHFVVDLEPQITICFNWDGKEGQIFNLLHDPVSGVTVNGQLTNLMDPDGAKHKKTFVNRIGIVLGHQNITLLITCDKMTITEKGKESREVYFSRKQKINLDGVNIQIIKFSLRTGEIVISIGSNIVFQIIKRNSNNHERIADHLDFYVLKNEGISAETFGVLGQFSRNLGKDKTPSNLDVQDGKKRAMLWYKNKAVRTRLKTIIDYNRGSRVECWHITENNDLFEKGRSRYLLKDMMAIPDLTAKTNKPKKNKDSAPK